MARGDESHHERRARVEPRALIHHVARRSVFVLAAAAVLHLSCAGENSNPVGSPLCARHGDCGSGLVCSRQQCLPVCGSTSDCPDLLSVCVDGACVAKDSGLCAVTSDCDVPSQCQTLPARCRDRQCIYTPLSAGTPCDDDDPATNDDACDGAGNCGERGARPAKLDLGFDCSIDGDEACASGLCIRGRCCVPGGDCCLSADDCPASYGAAASCHDVSPSTNCQGSRIDALCTNFVCGSVVVPDDRGCTGLAHACPNHLAAVTCGAGDDQRPPVCATRCSTTSAAAACAPGFLCQDNACVAAAGTGSRCTGEGQGSCPAGLKCENGLCCAATGPDCCDAGTLCPGGLACDPSTASCFVTCNNYDITRCAEPSLTRCMNNTCAATRGNGQACTADVQCASRHCVEGVCCDKACDETCASCVEALTGRPSGVCNPIEARSPDTAPTLKCASPGYGCGGTVCECAGGLTGTGACRSATGQACGDDLECSSGACECVDPACSQKTCTAMDCPPCTYSPDGVACVGPVVAGTTCNDASKCTTNDLCDEAGVCVGTAISCAPPRSCETGPASCTPSTGVCSYARKPYGIVCRPSSGPCDVAEICDGSTPTCPGNLYQPAGLSCGTCNCGTLTCNSTGACVSSLCQPAGTACPTPPPLPP